MISSSCSQAHENKHTSGNNSSLELTKDQHIVSFIYHRFGDRRYPSTNIAISEFEMQLKYLKDNEFEVVTISEGLSNANIKTKKNMVAITIDDAFLSFYENGFPLLKKYGFSATLFVNTETVGGNSYMTWDQLKEVKEYGIEIGNHSHSHAYFLNTDEQEVANIFKADVLKASALLQEHLHLKPKIFAYPYGEFNLAMKEVIRELDFDAAMAQNSGVIYSGSDRFSLPRFPMSSTYADFQGFVEKVNMKPLSIRSFYPSEGLIANNKKPELEIKIDAEGLLIEQLQCFIQGSSCNLTIGKVEEGGIAIKVSPNQYFERRRTLYTITVPDEQGNWHWYSYLWINPLVK